MVVAGQCRPPLLHHCRVRRLSPFIGNRHASSHDVPPEFLAKLRSAPAAIPRRERSKAPLPSAADTSAAGNSQAARSSDPTVICHELDRAGVVHVLGGKFPKSSICSSLGLLPRDLRKLDGTLKDQLPLILVRDSAILINIAHVKAIVKHDGVILFEDLSMEQRMKQHEFLLFVKTRLGQDRVAANHTPFEFIVLEAILQKTLQTLQDEFDAMQSEVEEHMRALESIVHWERLKILLVCRKRVAAFLERVNNIRSCLKELLDSDADMADMYLSDKHAAKTQERPTYAHEEMELLLENYLKIAEEITSRTQVLVSSMEATEDIVNIALVGQRNELVLLDLRIGIGTFAASMGGFGASVLGMNLHSGFENSPFAFYVVLGSLLSVASTSFVLVWRRMLRLIHHK